MNTNNLRKAVDDVNEMRSTESLLPVEIDPATGMPNFKDAHLDGYFYGPELSPDVVRALLDIADAGELVCKGANMTILHVVIDHWKELQKKGSTQ